MSEDRTTGTTAPQSLSVVERLRELETRATQAPWHHGRGYDHDDRGFTRPIVLEPLGKIGADELPASDDDAVLIAESRNALAVLLAVADAAKDVRENAKQAIGMEDPWGSQGPPILIGATDWFRLADAVDALDTGESPDSPPKDGVSP